MGNIPKDDEDRVRRNPVRFEEEIITEDGVIRGFDLPDHPNIQWCKLTRAWWEMWRRSPQAKLMIETDWWSLLEAAMIHNELWRIRRPDVARDKPLAASNVALLMAEMRRREDAFGATWEARKRNRLAIKTPQTEEEAEKQVKQAAEGAVDYMDKLTKAAATAKKLAEG